MLVQLHARNPKDPTQTEFLMQGVIDYESDFVGWNKLCKDKWEQMKDSIPNGWIPMVCNESYEGFILAPIKSECS